MLGIGRLINRFFAPFPLIRNLCLRQLLRVSLSAPRRRRPQVGVRDRAGAKRAWQHRSGGPPNPALRRRSRDHLRRGPLQGRDLGRDRARPAATRNTTSRRCASPAWARPTPSSPHERGARRRSHDPRRGPDHAARAAAEILAGHPLRHGEPRHRLLHLLAMSMLLTRQQASAAARDCGRRDPPLSIRARCCCACRVAFFRIKSL